MRPASSASRHRAWTSIAAGASAAAGIGIGEVQGKFNWKLDCALRWAIFKIHAEPFNKAYLEPQTGSFVVAQALSERFFGGHPVLPLHYGTVKMDRPLSYKLLESLPPAALRALLVERPTTDLSLTHDAVVAAASHHEVLPGMCSWTSSANCFRSGCSRRRV